MGPRVGLEKRKTFAPAGIRTLDFPVRSVVNIIDYANSTAPLAGSFEHYFGFRLILIINAPCSTVLLSIV